MIKRRPMIPTERVRDTTIYLGDMLKVLAILPDNSIDACVTDPPYHLVQNSRGGSASWGDLSTPYGRSGPSKTRSGFMGQEWDGGDIAFRATTWQAVYRVLKPGAHMLVFGGTRTFHRMACAVEDAGFEIRDTIMWVYGSGFPKSRDVSKALDREAGAVREVVGQRDRYLDGCTRQNQGNANNWGGTLGTNGVADITAPATPEAAAWSGWGTALKPAWEPIIVARKPCEGTVAANVLKHDTGAINIDGCRIETDGRPHRVINPKASANGSVYAGRQEAGHGFDGGSKAVGNTTEGRWPANVCHDGSDEVLALFPISTDGVAVGGKGRSASIYGTETGGPKQEDQGYGGSGSAARFFYCSKADADDRAWSKHPTVKPLALMRWLVRLVTPPNGTVLDPFAGSGTTGAAAQIEGFKCVLIEREPSYIKDILRRLGSGPQSDTPTAQLPRHEKTGFFY